MPLRPPQTDIRGGFKSRLFGRLAYWLIRVLMGTLRVQVIDYSGITRPGFPAPAILCLWHSSILFIPSQRKKQLANRKRIVALASASRDGTVLEEILRGFGIEAVRGSSSRRAVSALVALRRALREGSDLAITPDGPRGPRQKVQPGILRLASISQAPVIPCILHCQHAWTLKTWDRLQIPLPFSKATVILGHPLHFSGDDDLQSQAARLEKAMESSLRHLRGNRNDAGASGSR